ncbi:MAG: outer membrane beta-barrel protein [Gloeocapsa sp. UFS-A4-WI-NPMV-4B04]|nr:outer membrane beta-barrel protein [Gloeocapsa sp. UFS-A4-WI-NPMV-4B04]
MAKVEGKATIPFLDNRRSLLLCSQQRQTLPRLSRKYLACLIVFVSCSAAWVVGGVAIAANPSSCHKAKRTATLLPIEKTNDLSCITTKRSPINSEIAQIKSQNKHSALLNTATTTKTNQQLPLSLCCGQLKTISPYCSRGEVQKVASPEEGQLLKCRSSYQRRLNQRQAKSPQQLSHKSLQQRTIPNNLQGESEKIIGSSQPARINVDGVWVADLEQSTLKSSMTKLRLAEALSSHGNYYDQAIASLRPHSVAESSDSLPLEVIQPYVSANVKVVPFFELNTQTADNLSNTQQSKIKPQLKLQQASPLLSPQAQPTLTADKLNQPRLDGDPELGNLRVRQLEVQPRQTQGDSSELGNLRVRELEVKPRQAQADSELGTLRVRALETDNDLELGNIRVREQEFLPPRQEAQSPQFKPTVRLLSQIGYFRTNNIFSGIDPVNDSLLSFGLTFWATSALGPKTALVTAVDGSLIRYLDQTEFNYNQLRFRASIRQQLAPRMYGEFGFNNQKLFRAESGARFLNENSFRLALQRRDQLTKKLRLDTTYEFRLNDANPETRSRIINSLAVSLSYPLKRNLLVGLDYQFGLSNFTQRDREDQYHRLLGRLNYAVSRNSQINLQTGLTFGGSSDPNIDFDNFFFSVTYTMELGKF